MSSHFGSGNGLAFGSAHGAGSAYAEAAGEAHARILQLQAEIKRLAALVDQRDAIIAGQKATTDALKAELPAGHKFLQMTDQKYNDGDTKSVLSASIFEPAFIAKAQELKVPQKLIDSIT